MKQGLLGILLHFIILSALIGQNDTLYFRHFSLEHGLSQKNVTSIIQDSLGFMWFGTHEGLNKYDGYKFIPFKHDPKNKNSLVNDDITCLSVQKNGIFYIGTRFNGFNEYNPYTGQFTLFRRDDKSQNTLSDDRINALYFDEEAKMLWIGTANGLNAFNPKTKNYTHYQSEEGLSNENHITCITKDKSGILWIGTAGGGLRSFNQINKTFKKYIYCNKGENCISSNIIRDVFADKENNIWLATPAGLNVIHTATGKIDIYKHRGQDPNSIISDNITSVYQDKYGKIWAGTALHGLSVFYPKTGKFYCYSHDEKLPNSLGSNKINTVSQGRSGMFWAASSDGGLNSFNPKTLKFNLLNPIPKNQDENINENISFVYQFAEQCLLIGTQNHGLYVYDLKQKNIKRHQISLSHANNNINCVYTDKDGQILLGTDDGLMVYRPTTNTLEKNTTFENIQIKNGKTEATKISCIYRDNKNVLWIGTKEKGLIAYDQKLGRCLYYSHDKRNTTGISDNRITAVNEEQDGTLWIGTFGGGVNTFDRNQSIFKVYQADNKSVHAIGSNFINQIYIDKSQKVWISTWGGGLNCFDKKGERFNCYTMQDGLPGNSMNGIIQDDSLNLWIGTDNGICKLKFKDQKLVQCRVFDLIDGLPSTEFYHANFFRNKFGRFLINSKKGIISYHPDSLRNNPYKPPVIITDFQLFNKSIQVGDSTKILKEDISITKEIQLAYNQNSFSFEFTAISFINPGKNKYAFMLEGFDKDWNYRNAQNRMATYTNLAPGAYVFKVKASNNDGVWNDKGTAIKICIAAPFWKTWWFISSIVGLVLIVTVVLIRVRLARQREIEKMRSNIARDLHDDMGSTLSSVSILSRLAMESEGKDMVLTKEIINKISDHSQTMMNSMDDIVWAINPSNDSLKNISLRMFAYASEVLESKQVHYTITVPDDMENIKLKIDSRRDFYLIFKEALNNMAKYAACKHAEVKIYKEKQNLVMIIKDDGVGFDLTAFDRGNGLRNMQERAKTLHGNITLQSEKNKGTEITLTIPLR